MNVLRHHNITDHDKAITLPRLFKNFEEAVGRLCRVEERQPSITRASDKVQMVSTVGAVEADGDDKPIESAASYPPLYKTQERGTHSFGMGKKKTRRERLGHPPGGSHPCKERKDGAPFVVMVRRET